MENLRRSMSPVRISGYALYEDDFEDLELPKSPPSLYSNLTLVSVSKTAPLEKGMWHAAEMEPNPSSSSGTFTRLLKTTVQRNSVTVNGKPNKTETAHPEAHGVTLNLHQFHSDSGDSLGDDPDSWARLRF